MEDCVVSTPPSVEDGSVVFNVVHNDSGRVFRCEMTDFDSVEIMPLPRDMTPWAEGETRGAVAERALEYARDNADLFERLFEEAQGRPTP
jgi:hypothetical protein